MLGASAVLQRKGGVLFRAPPYFLLLLQPYQAQSTGPGATFRARSRRGGCFEVLRQVPPWINAVVGETQGCPTRRDARSRSPKRRRRGRSQT